MHTPMQLDWDALSTSGDHLVTWSDQVMEVIVNRPTTATPRGIAVVAHPHPLLGGSAKHKVPHALATALADTGWWVLRPNFRGVGRSSGEHDHGQGELEDLSALHAAIRHTHPDAPLVLLGFSFGAYVTAHLAARLSARLAQSAEPEPRVVLMGLPYGQVPAGRHYDTPPPTANVRVIHGELDAAAPLSGVLDWARPSGQAVTVIPGADHFFSGRLPLLRTLVLESIQHSS